ncbi:S66 peptidase family protein [Tissierella sp. Yu-01]|uniref:S66 family peptidase n=1 Tax=Tissierella sp. Yu-01 TaxID=3035694 RepID=UPI00240DB30E|nr:S66 peptidase family protein [Tissierella sp. Yu-01]WFA07702.1 LD-carboxypeptidase [Tissierella sp. Yu-01]
MKLISPNKLQAGDTVATVSLSWGGAGDKDLLWRYQVGKQRLEEVFGLKVVEMEHTLMGTEYIYKHPEARAKDLMDAFRNSDIKAIFSCIGGDDSIRMLPYIDFDIISKNPKIFIGYSDSTITHLICYKAGITSFYGPSVLAEFAENIKIYDYTTEYINKTLFSNDPVGLIQAEKKWTGERIEWIEDNKNISKRMEDNLGYEFLQGSGIVKGRLFGGCIEVLEMAKGTILWPDDDTFDGAILFFETSEETPHPDNLLYWLRNYAAMGVLQKSKAILFGKPYQAKYYDEYKEVIKTIVDENNLYNIPIVYNMTFGHNEPMCILPYGVLAEVNCEDKTFRIMESGVF